MGTRSGETLPFELRMFSSPFSPVRIGDSGLAAMNVFLASRSSRFVSRIRTSVSCDSCRASPSLP